MINHDVIIIGAGLAGLTAAYNLAKEEVDVKVFDRLPKSGILDHPCGCMVSPVPNSITFKNSSEGILYKEVDFLFTEDMILEYPGKMEFIMPNGCKFGMAIENPQDEQIFQIDKEKVLIELAERAEREGAQLEYGTNVSKLLIEKGQVKGILASGQQVRSHLVLSGEGLSRRFSYQAGLFDSDPEAYIFSYAVHLLDLHLKKEEIGQIGYFGENLVQIPKSSVIFHSYGDDKALILISVLLDEYKWFFDKSVEEYLLNAISKVPFLEEIYKRGKAYEKNACWMKIAKPKKLVDHGFIGMGDSVAPLGHSSNSIAMLMGKEAANTAIEALQTQDYSYSALKSYNKWLESDLFGGVEFEAKLIMTLLNFSDSDLNKICNAFEGINLEPFFIGSRWDIIKASLKLLFKKRILKNWKLIRQLF
ncbi:MAG: hypothetical protein BAJALOKI3v1_40027 [Promethearchaeota archaeon]|nr:MAG: hypothetical protein BAJALOKI3v1_40027 [Candidatus Lokiarchaeota archaeon]